MDRVFEPVRPVVAITPPITPEQESLDRRPVWRSKAVLGVVLISSAAISLAALTALLMWRQWMETRQQLQQERQAWCQSNCWQTFRRASRASSAEIQQADPKGFQK